MSRPGADNTSRFVPHPWLRGGHVQTVVGRYLPGPPQRLPSHDHQIEVSGGDRLLVHESIPRRWVETDPTAVFVHGLGGCARSPYVTRVAGRLARRGIRTVRMNLRGAGRGFGLARQVYHAGRSEDVRRVVEWLNSRAPASPVALIGFSLGGNLVLKLAAEAADDPLAGFDCVLAVNPPIDLLACSQQILHPSNRIYDQNFVRLLRSDVRRLHRRFPELGPAGLEQVHTLLDFDEHYTAPRNGFANALDYYAQSSSARLIPRIQAAGLVVHAIDDPFIPSSAFERVAFPPQLELELTPGGGHLGYLSRNRWGGHSRWIDARLETWLVEHWATHLRADRLP